MAPSRTRLALVGYGMAGRLFHRPHVLAAGLTVSLVATADPGRADQARADLPEAQIVPDLDAVLQARPDAVVLASPTGVHASQAVACVRAGIPVIVDKPLGVDAATARQAVLEADRAGVPLTVFQNRRWDADQLTLAALLQAGTLGDPVRVERRYERWRPTPRQGWRGERPASEGGGLLLDLSVHQIDQVIQLFGPVTSVYAELEARGTVAEDEVFLSLRHASGMRSHLGVGVLAAGPGPHLRVLGREATYLVANLPDDLRAFTAPADEPGFTGWLVRGADAEPVPTAPGSQTDFYRLVPGWLAGGAPPVDPWDAVRVLAVIDAARVSHREGRPVTLEPQVP